MATQAPTLTYRCPHCNQAVEVDVRPENEVLVCPNQNCQKPFKVDVPTAQPAPELAPTPTSNGVGAQAAPAVTATVPQIAAAAPAAAQTLTAHPPEVKEETLEIVRLAMFRRYPLRVLAYLIVLIGGAVGAILWGINGYLILAVLCIALGGWAGVRLGLWWLRMKNTVLVITNKRCLVETGVMKSHSSDMALADIREVQVIQPFLLGLLNVGDLLLMSKHGGAKQSILVMAVPSPEAVARRIQDLRPL